MTFVVVPQWQGSPSSRAMRLAEGAEAIRADLPASSTREVAVPLEAGDEQGTGIARFGSLQLVRERLGDVLGELDDAAIVIGGDCSVSSAAVAHTAGPDLALVWFDAHPDLNTPGTSPSGAFGGMVLASLVEDGVVDAGRVVVAGAREWDPGEEEFAGARGIASVDVAALADAAAFADAVAATGATRVYVHIDLDVLDPAEFDGLLEPIPFGVSATQLVAAVRALVARLPLAGATIASFAPESAEKAVDDAPTILRLIAALRG
ncbi:arginase family protein [Protaetiibacter mangrovi]|uniref:Arginase family protein n=1 Tax=Protaetiibacter mangrovi TaxID=2970926 RepID=A0ABT1ZIZ9_9MICO|nr:arginase family protein [Protaetiibacter mangrovi]MCS0500673.1 arginase family protein [Protaetiibacter mangrovi]TPX04735.1 arginase family protein [Schumannella luteola]